jgi:hypothetical protein
MRNPNENSKTITLEYMQAFGVVLSIIALTIFATSLIDEKMSDARRTQFVGTPTTPLDEKVTQLRIERLELKVSLLEQAKQKEEDARSK